MDSNNVIQADVTSISQISQGATSHGYTNNWNVNYEYNEGHSIAVSHFNWRQESGATKRALIIENVFLVCFCGFTGLTLFLFFRQKNKVKSL